MRADVKANECAHPTWANIVVIEARTRTMEWSGSCAIHGLPHLGDAFDLTGFAGVRADYGLVTAVMWAPTVDGSLKATIEVKAIGVET